jgi:hypothetical protein
MKTKTYFKTSVAKAMLDPIETTVLQDVLLMVNVDLPRELLCRWNVMERAIAEDWAVRLHLRASDAFDRAASTEALMATRSKNPTGTIFDLLR